ncbi:hypothetical protein PanWU01x14_339810, partial [Parasponia andersonii]
VGYLRWARYYASRRRYITMTSNILESMNSALDDARSLPIVPLLETIRQKVQDWFVSRGFLALSTRIQLTPWAKDN